jgi:hypothetical protein
MAHSDDPKDQPEDVSSPEQATKKPLGFEQEVAPADPSLAGRRLFLKLALFGAAAAMVPQGVQAALQRVDNVDRSSPVELPYKNTLAFQDQPGTLTDGKEQGEYLVSGTGDLYIDAAGGIFLSNVQATGTWVSGLNVGTISVVQPTPAAAGKYSGTALEANTTVLYSDAEARQQPASLRLAGDLYTGGASLNIGVDFQRVSTTRPDVYVQVTWSKATC